MVNDSVINFYLRYMLTQYIDSRLRREGIDLQKAQDLASQPEKLRDGYFPKNAEEENAATPTVVAPSASSEPEKVDVPVQSA